jgi:hypothetical protein
MSLDDRHEKLEDGIQNRDDADDDEAMPIE